MFLKNANKLRNTIEILKKKKVSVAKLLIPLSYMQLIAQSPCLLWVLGLISIQDQRAIPTHKFLMLCHQM